MLSSCCLRDTVLVSGVGGGSGEDQTPPPRPSVTLKETLQGTLTPRGLGGPSFPSPSQCVVVEALSLETRETREGCKGSPGSGRPDEEGVCARLCAKGHLLL